MPALNRAKADPLLHIANEPCYLTESVAGHRQQ